MSALRIYRKWEGKEAFYKMLMERGTLADDMYPIDLGPFSFYLEAFFELSTCRAVGFGMGPIPANIIYDYADRFDLSFFFCTVIRALDLLYLKEMDSSKKEKDKKKESKSI